MDVAPADVPVFRRVFEEHLDYVWRVLRHLGVPERDLEDVAQEVFVVVHRRLPEFEPRASLKTWLWSIAWRVAKTHARSARRRPVDLVEDVDREEERTDPEGKAARAQAIAQLDRALAELDPSQRQVFLLYEVEGLSMQVIVEEIGVPLQTGYSRLRLAREKVRAMISGHRDG
jgi:RNA polymerase sigma-70 factor (ECF subfamily)